MKKLEELQKLLKAANAISKSVKDYKEIYTQDSSCDKKGFGFNLDDRFAACEGLNLRVDSWKGWYGSSNCSTIFDVDKEIFNRHLMGVLRGKFWQLLSETEKSILHEAAALKEDAKKELSEKLDIIEKL